MKIYIQTLLGAVFFLQCAACAPDLGWSGEAACLTLHCGSPQVPCWASTPQLRIELDRGLVDAGENLPSVAVLPWGVSKGALRCVEDAGCEEQERCLAGQCWRAPVSGAAVARWRSGKGALPKPLPGWWARQIGERSLGLSSSLGSEAGGVWGVYLGPRWVDESGQALNVGPRPALWLEVQAHGAGRWSEQVPELLDEGHRLRLSFPKGWSEEASYRWSLSCGPGLGMALVAERSCEGAPPCVDFVFSKPLDIGQRSCRVLVKLPGQAALPSGWIRSPGDPVSAEVLPAAGLGYGDAAW